MRKANGAKVKKEAFENAELNSAIIIAECFNVLLDEAIGIWDCRLGQKVLRIMNRSFASV